MSLMTLDNIKWQSYAQAFSRKAFINILAYNDFSYLNWIVSQFDRDFCKKNRTYIDYLSYVYRQLLHNYRNEYVYKNEIINQWLLKKYGTKETAYFNEYKVGNSIVDLAMFNGESKAFEIKSDLDNPTRLKKQLQDYCRVFDKCFIVIPIDKKNDYEQYLDPRIGIITLSESKGKIQLREAREALQNSTFDKELSMQSMHTNEFCDIIYQLTGAIPSLTMENWYQECKKIFLSLSEEDIKLLFLKLVKKRKNSTHVLRNFPSPIRQMMLSLNLNEKQRSQLDVKLKTNISPYVLPTTTSKTV
ncbi:MAG: sce7726 family protein [Bacteroidales bacterium]|nr:sce7726 family protein [Candidatus Colicola caccequi]